MTWITHKIVEQRVRAQAVTILFEQPVTVLDLLSALETVGLRLEPDKIGYVREAARMEAEHVNAELEKGAGS